MDDEIITTINVLWEISKTAPFVRCPQAIIYQGSIHHSQQYINYCCQNNLLSMCLRNSAISFLHETIVHKPVFITHSKKVW